MRSKGEHVRSEEWSAGWQDADRADMVKPRAQGNPAATLHTGLAGAKLGRRTHQLPGAKGLVRNPTVNPMILKDLIPRILATLQKSMGLL